MGLDVCVAGAGGSEERSSAAAYLRIAGAIPYSDGEERFESAGRRALVHPDHIQRARGRVRAERHPDAEVCSVDLREGGIVQVERHAAFVPGGAADKDASATGCAAGVGARGEGDACDAGEAADREGQAYQVGAGWDVGSVWVGDGCGWKWGLSC